MENRFIRIDANPIDRKCRYNYNVKVISDSLSSLRRKIQTKDDYVLWVREWKEIHADLVKAIQYFRIIKNRVKYDVAFANSTSDNCNMLQNRKKFLGSVANALYEMRTDNKAALKAGQYAEVTETV